MANSCETCKHYEVEAYNEPCNSCRFRDYDVPTKWESPFKQQKTNADRIRAMSDEELARWALQFVIDCAAQSGIEDPEWEDGAEEILTEWLKQPAEVTDNEKA